MITSWFIQRALDWRTYALIALIGVLATITYKIDKHGYSKGYAQAIAINQSKIDGLERQVKLDAEMYQQSLIESSQKTLAWQAQVNKANEVANNAQTKYETLLTVNSSLSNSLHEQRNKTAVKINDPTSSNESIKEYATTLSGLFEDCSSKYLGLATDYQQDSINEQKLIDSYPTQ